MSLTLLHQAVHRENLEDVIDLLSKGVDVMRYGYYILIIKMK